ncbi:chemotaxis protein CheW [Ectothiorhodospiraceae bacterium 2226]|nr:chemotaxis protein CheW [Ectothiorhodospiraceae bacterium 2226]
MTEIEARCRAHAAGLPQQVQSRATWSGIAFRIGDARLVAPLDEVREILRPPSLTRVPGTKPWVKGIANVRGNLLPVVDLSDYLGVAAGPSGRRTRVLVAQEGELTVGLIVSEVSGLRHFFADTHTPAIPPVAIGLQGLLRGSYALEDELWPVFSLHRLAASQSFREVAL